LTSYFPDMLLTYFLNDFEIVPVAPLLLLLFLLLSILLLLLLVVVVVVVVVLTAIELTLGGSSPYTSTDK